MELINLYGFYYSDGYMELYPNTLNLTIGKYQLKYIGYVATNGSDGYHNTSMTPLGQLVYRASSYSAPRKMSGRGLSVGDGLVRAVKVAPGSPSGFKR